jgi:hypothetical protein
VQEQLLTIHEARVKQLVQRGSACLPCQLCLFVALLLLCIHGCCCSCGCDGLLASLADRRGCRKQPGVVAIWVAHGNLLHGSNLRRRQGRHFAHPDGRLQVIHQHGDACKRGGVRPLLPLVVQQGMQVRQQPCQPKQLLQRLHRDWPQQQEHAQPQGLWHTVCS